MVPSHNNHPHLPFPRLIKMFFPHHLPVLLFLFLVLCTSYSPTLSLVQATTFTYRIAPHEKTCFHAMSKYPNEKIGFYFAIQSGGEFYIDYDVRDPSGTTILSGTRERQADHIFVGKTVGEYSFCFQNQEEGSIEKMIDMDVTVNYELEKGASSLPLSSKAAATSTGGSGGASASGGGNGTEAPKVLAPIQDYLFKISTSISNIQRLEKRYKTRENRNFSTVKSTESRVFWLSIMVSAIMVAVSVGQIYMIKNFFSRKGKSRI